MSAKPVGMHLNDELDDTALMPMMKDLKRAAARRCRYVADLPAPPGPHAIAVYASDAAHKTIAAAVRRVEVMAITGKASR
jgi:hypothetical protein